MTFIKRVARSRTLASIALVAIAVLAIAGCGSGGGGDSTSAATAPTTTEQVVVQSTGGNFNPAQIYRDASPGVVTVISVFNTSGGSSILGNSPAAGQGSGFVVSKDGEIVTNAHVVTNGGRLNGGGTPTEAKQVFVEFADQNRVPAQIVGFDADADVALIKVDPDSLDLHTVSLSDRSNFVVGEPVAAIGSPFGESQSLSVGVISAVNRTVEGLTNFGIDHAIQTDASINPGNSGGPLLDAKGQVIGINEQIASNSGSNSGVGFAIPVTSVRYSLDQLRSSGKVDYAFLGVTSETLYPQLAEHLNLNVEHGAMITDVVKGGPADKAGIHGATGETTFELQHVKTGGDIIVAVDGKPVIANDDLSELIAAHKPGDEVTLDVVRDGEHHDIHLTLEARPEDVNK